MALMSKEVLFPGDEITVNYGYKVTLCFLVKRNARGLETLKIPLFQLPFAPPWFQEQWFEHVRNEEQWDENKIMGYCSNVSRR